MGRPAIGNFVGVRFAPETLARIDAIAAPGKRAEFVRHAVELALTEAERGAADDRGGAGTADSPKT